jgi:predicted CoA-substrate-specific enzyme activase
MLSAGLDVGARTAKAVIWDGSRILGRGIAPTGWTPLASARKALEMALTEARVDQAAKVIATGYGRVTVPFANRTITEITAHARGIGYLLPNARTLIDIGGQDSKAIILENGGLVADFAMNDRCAAGSGKFLEFLAMTMGLGVEEFAELAFRSENPTVISSICTVFAESEVLSLLAEGAPREDVACGVHRAIAQRIAQLTASLHPVPPAAFSGGVARNRCMVRELQQVLGMEILAPEWPEYAGALGAALTVS